MPRTLPIRLRTIAAAITVIGSGIIIFSAYQSIINSTDSMPQTMPIIHADKEPFRVKPLDPGGAEIPNQGNTLFDVLQSDNPDELALDGAVINEPETEAYEKTVIATDDAPPSGFELPDIPEPRTESLYGVIEEMKSEDRADLQDTLKSVIEDKEASTDVDETTAAATVKPQVKPSAPVSLKPQVQAAPKVEEKKEEAFSIEKVLASEPNIKRYYIQLASLRSKTDAEAAYERIRDKFPNLVKGISVFYPQVDLAGKGTFTRIQIGPLDEADARRRCADYTATKGGGTCLVINR